MREVDGHREIRVGVTKTEEEALESPLIKELVGHEHTRTQIHRIEVSETGAEVEEEMRMESRRIHIREDD